MVHYLVVLFLVFFNQTAFANKTKTLNQKKGFSLNLNSMDKNAIISELKAKQILLIDLVTGEMLLEKNSDEQMHPSSMTKIMTAYIVMEKIKNNTITEQTNFMASRSVSGLEGTSIYLEVGQKVSVIDLLYGLMVNSGNDAAVVLAEGISGTEENFAHEMNKKAKELGAKNTNFVNASGLPKENHLTTSRDLAIIAKRLIDDFPEYYHIFSNTQFSFNNINQMNKNPLLYKNSNLNSNYAIVYDGIKTGSSQIAGYGIVASAIYKGRRLLLVINGLPSKQSRADEAFHLLNWGMNNFGNYEFFDKNEVVTKIPVYYGSQDYIDLVIKDGSGIFTIEKRNLDGISAKIIYKDLVVAPIQKNQELGYLEVSHKNWQKTLKFPLIANQEVTRSGFLKRIGQNLAYLFNVNSI
jgi:D-alanyl-D-alanine carboxypeptidase (penicillin-binding protein 5/6)